MHICTRRVYGNVAIMLTLRRLNTYYTCSNDIDSCTRQVANQELQLDLGVVVELAGSNKACHTPQPPERAILATALVILYMQY